MYNTEEILEKKEINGEELEYLLSERKNKRAEFLLVDVREEYEHNEKKIVGVDHLLPLSNFFNKVKDINQHKSKHIITKCKIGGRSAQAQMHLQLLGFNKVINLAGGISNYKGEVT
jgi:rhodanese-related sulfurtransferase